MIPKSFTTTPLVSLVLLLGHQESLGLIFFETADPAHNREVAPGGAWAGSGWQFQGEFKGFLGTMISPRHFVTAQHVGVGAGGTTFVHKTFFSGEASDRTYYVNPNVNGGTGYWNIADTDLRIFEVYGDFPAHAEIYTKTDEVGKQTVMMGRGRQRGAAVELASQTRGWLWGVNDSRARWGVNDVDFIDWRFAVGDLLVSDFDPVTGTEECQAASGDSGGALFIQDGPTWKLAGIMYAVDGRYDTNTTCYDSSDFIGAMFNAFGFFIGKDSAACDEWEPVSLIDDTVESRTFSSRISSSAGAIQAIIQTAIDDAAKTHRQRFDEWITSFGSVYNTLPEQDADNDLWPNVVEYLAALDPSAVDDPKRPFLVEDAGDKIRFTVRVRLDAEARGLSWEIRETDDLVYKPYLPVSGLLQVGLNRSLAEGVETITYEIDKPANPRMFYRLEVSLAL